MPQSSLNAQLLLGAADNRHGITFEPQLAIKSDSDLLALYHAGVPSSVIAPWQSASGGVSRDELKARLSAIGESLERFSAATVQLPTYTASQIDTSRTLEYEHWPLFSHEQRNDPNFPFGAIYDRETFFVEVRSFTDKNTYYAPQPLVVLRDDFETGLPTSSGLAAAPNAQQALLSAILELIERDALMVTWLHGLSGHRIELPDDYQKEVSALQGNCFVYDLTPIYSPYPVVAVIGDIQKDGNKRFSLGVACKTTYSEAIEKAYNEWHQGVFFAGIFADKVDVSHLDTPESVNTFDDHAVYYTLHPERWDKLPIFGDQKIRKPRLTIEDKPPTFAYALKTLQKSLHQAGVRVFYVDLSGIDALQAGVRVVRAVSPDLAMIFAHQSWPLIDKVGSFLHSRYPLAKTTLDFPFLMPHPLG